MLLDINNVILFIVKNTIFEIKYICLRYLFILRSVKQW